MIIDDRKYRPPVEEQEIRTMMQYSAVVELIQRMQEMRYRICIGKPLANDDIAEIEKRIVLQMKYADEERCKMVNMYDVKK